MKNTTKAKITKHVTGVGEILFMFVKVPFTDKATGKQEYTIKLKLAESDDAVGHLLEVSPAKIDTKVNAKLTDGTKIINFGSSYQPIVADAEGNKIDSTNIPFFDSRVDKGKAKVEYSVIEYPNKTIVRLSSIQLVDLQLAPREGEKSISALEQEILNA